MVFNILYIYYVCGNVMFEGPKSVKLIILVELQFLLSVFLPSNNTLCNVQVLKTVYNRLHNCDTMYD